MQGKVLCAIAGTLVGTIGGYWVGKSVGVFISERKLQGAQRLQEGIFTMSKAMELINQGQIDEAMSLVEDYKVYARSMTTSPE